MIIQKGKFYTKSKPQRKKPSFYFGSDNIRRVQTSVKERTRLASEEELKRERDRKISEESPKLFYTPEEVSYREDAMIILYFWNKDLKSELSLTPNKVSKLAYHRIYLKGCKWDYIYVMNGMEKKLEELYF